MDGLVTICHEAQKGGYIGSHWPNDVRASALLDAGGAPMSTNIARQVVQAFKKQASLERGDVPDLSPQEREVPELLAKGYQSKKIATQLGIAY